MPMSPRDRRALIIFGSVAVVAAAVFFLFIGRGSKSPQSSSPSGPQPNVGQPAPSPSASPSKKPQKEVLVFSGRDPFDPLQGGGSVAAPAGSAAVSPPGSPASGPGGGSSADVGGKTVVLVSIFTQNGQEQAQVEVDGTVYTVGEGDTFDDGYRLVSIDGSCADFTHSSSSFTLCETANK
jgi:hypothetical protein